jgi:hypothetical protein
MIGDLVKCPIAALTLIVKHTRLLSKHSHNTRQQQECGVNGFLSVIRDKTPHQTESPNSYCTGANATFVYCRVKTGQEAKRL